MTKIHALVVGKNEENRWLESTLKWNGQYVDSMFFYDDVSTDKTPRVANANVSHFVIRPPGVPSFTENESAFRQAAWDKMERTLRPEEEDWIVVLDCDEFLVGNLRTPNARENMLDLIEAADMVKRDSVYIHILEMWDLDGTPKLRTDGFWNDNKHPRLVKFKKGQKFKEQKMGCPPVPDYATKKPLNLISIMNILHFGYVRPEDREIKHERYTKNAEGHATGHIQSIVEEPVLLEYRGVVPDYWTGVKA